MRKVQSVAERQHLTRRCKGLGGRNEAADADHVRRMIGRIGCTDSHARACGIRHDAVDVIDPARAVRVCHGLQRGPETDHEVERGSTTEVITIKVMPRLRRLTTDHMELTFRSAR